MEIRSWTDVSEERLNESISRKMFWGRNIMVTLWELAPNTSLPVHDHVSEQVTMVQSGSVTLLFPEDTDVTLGPGQMIVIPPSKPHGVKVGEGGCKVMDLFSPIREDFIAGTAAYISAGAKAGEQKEPDAGQPPGPDPYAELQSYLVASGINVPLEKLKELPLDLLARYVYEKECITMGQLRRVLKLDMKQAKDLLRKWKHGDDHSESSLKRKLERLILLPGDPAGFRAS